MTAPPYAASGTEGLNDEGARQRFHLDLALLAGEVSVALVCHLDAAVAEMAGHPRERPMGFERDPGERMAQAVEGALLAGRSDARHFGRFHGVVEDAHEGRGREITRPAEARENERLVIRLATLSPPAPE